jgi:hypothetical protein
MYLEDYLLICDHLNHSGSGDSGDDSGRFGEWFH